MLKLLYLDQNILSDLRERKIAEGTDGGLKNFLLRIQGALAVRTVYSSVHLDEIKQIPKSDYVEEHISLLSSLDALYIEPLTHQLSSRNPPDVWAAYLKNEDDNRDMGVDAVTQQLDLLQRKLSGLAVEEPIDALGTKIQDSLRSMRMNAVTEVRNIDPNSISAEERSQLPQLRRVLEAQLAQVNESKNLNIDERTPLGPKSFRNSGLLSGIDARLSADDIIPVLEQVFASTNPDFKWESYFDKTTDSQIARCYWLMNWAGYHADDFTHTKKSKDRFGASMKDMAHVQYAAYCHYLISKDVAFSKKALACYKYLRLPIKVLTPDAFLVDQET